MTTSNRLFGNISTIYMATTQCTIFGLLRITQSFCYSHLPNICLLQIDKLFQHWKPSTYSVTVRRKFVWQLQIAYLEIFRRFIWLLRKAQFLGYCASITFLLQIYQLFIYCKSSNYFKTGNHLNICLLCIDKLYYNIKSSIWKRFNDLYGYC